MEIKPSFNASLSNFSEKKITDLDTESNLFVILLHFRVWPLRPVEYFKKVDTAHPGPKNCTWPL